uniref:Uncharacterized protein n=1 Tax=Quercus lobata TaxID=97700 RepID=A0A7N2KUV0_QUELO
MYNFKLPCVQSIIGFVSKFRIISIHISHNYQSYLKSFHNFQAWVLWFLAWRAQREAGFTEQRKPPALNSGRITGWCASEPKLPCYDFVVVDMEHSHGGISEALPLVFKPWLPLKPQLYSRLPESSAAWAKKALDLGPQGIMFRKPSPIAGTHQTEYVERPTLL